MSIKYEIHKDFIFKTYEMTGNKGDMYVAHGIVDFDENDSPFTPDCKILSEQSRVSEYKPYDHLGIFVSGNASVQRLKSDKFSRFGFDNTGGYSHNLDCNNRPFQIAGTFKIAFMENDTKYFCIEILDKSKKYHYKTIELPFGSESIAESFGGDNYILVLCGSVNIDGNEISSYGVYKTNSQCVVEAKEDSIVVYISTDGFGVL